MSHTDELHEYHAELHREILAEAEDRETPPLEVFTQYVVDAISELENLEATIVSYRGEKLRKHLRVDGYHLEAAEDSDARTLSLIVTDYSHALTIERIDQKAQDQLRRYALNFLDRCQDPTFARDLDYTTPAHQMVDTIHRAIAQDQIRKIRIFLFTSRKNSSKSDGESVASWNGIPVTQSTWDLARLRKTQSEGGEREDIEIDLIETFQQGLPALVTHRNVDEYHAYMTVIPGEMLARIYHHWESRLLEQNVRVFLQAAGKVNKGIRETLRTEPHMFLAFNNGITATAEGVDYDSERREIRKITNLQIVNGGQTTASIHAAYLNKYDLSQVFVPMKLSIIPEDRVDKVVPLISRYANTQNAVSAADFFSNHPYHQKLETLSRTIECPDVTHRGITSKWFYERTKGQYNSEKNSAKRSGKKQLGRFEADYPKAQYFTKTDLAKFRMTWDQLPHDVSLGSQKLFAKFAKSIAEQWDKSPEQFGSDYYKESIAQAIAYKHTKRIVERAPWYVEKKGYLANIIAYAIARVAYEAQKLDMAVDFNAIWRNQAISEELSGALLTAAKVARDVIWNPPSQVSNPSEWAKRSACWDQLRDRPIEFPDAWEMALVGGDEKKERLAARKTSQSLESEIAIFEYINEWPPTTWPNLIQFGRKHRLFKGEFEARALEVAHSFAQTRRSPLPTERQKQSIARIIHECEKRGWERPDV